MLCLIDEFMRECLTIRIARRLIGYRVIETLAQARLARGAAERSRSDRSPEFIAQAVRDWTSADGTRIAHREGRSLGEGLLRFDGRDIDGLGRRADSQRTREVAPSLGAGQSIWPAGPWPIRASSSARSRAT